MLYLQFKVSSISLCRFPSDKYPVLALKGAPASFPMQRGDCNLQQYLQWSDYIQSEGNEYIQKNFPGEKFVGLHLRNGADWVI